MERRRWVLGVMAAVWLLGPIRPTLADPKVGRPAHNSRLAVSADGRFLATVNFDNGSVSLVDLKDRKKLNEVPVGRSPESVCFLGEGIKAAATAWGDDQVVLIDSFDPVNVRKIQVPDEPFGVVATPDGRRIYVTHAYPGLVTEIDTEAGKIVRTIEVGEFPRGIAFTSDGGKLLVTHDYTGWVSVLDVASGKVIDQWQGASADNLASQVVVHPTLPFAYVPHIRSRVQRTEGTSSIFPFCTVVDLRPEPAKRRIPIAMDNYNGITPPADPAEIAISPDGKRHYIVYGGTNDMNVSDVIDGYPYLKPARGLVRLGHHPTGISVSPDSREVYVLNALDFNVWVFQADPFQKVAEIPVSQNPLSEQVLLGKQLFHQAGNPMSSRRWISCASCHPGGDHDGRTWHNPEGKRNTTALFGMMRTHPLHWSADRDETQDFEHTIRGPLMRGSGLLKGSLPAELSDSIAGRSEALDALAAYCNSLEPSLSPHALAPGKLTEAAERGRLLFESKAVGCVECHPAPTYTDSALEPRPFRMHDIGTGTGDETEKLGPKYDTPSLIGVYRSAPYLHDGRAATLRDVLTTQNPNETHGKTKHLSDKELDELVDFLKSLPYLQESMKTGPN